MPSDVPASCSSAGRRSASGIGRVGGGVGWQRRWRHEPPWRQARDPSGFRIPMLCTLACTLAVEGGPRAGVDWA